VASALGAWKRQSTEATKLLPGAVLVQPREGLVDLPGFVAGGGPAPVAHALDELL
jgi:hypothetical protein